MARIDYFDLMLEIKSILDADSSLNGVTFGVMTYPNDMSADSPFVHISIDRREPTEEQTLSANKRMRYDVYFNIINMHYGLDGIDSITQDRDDLLSKIELVLMANPTLNDKVSYTFLEGGDLSSEAGPDGTGYRSEGQTILRAEVSAINT